MGDAISIRDASQASQAALELPLAHLVGHRIADRLPLPPIEAALYEYVLAGNGVFVRGKREGMEALVPVRHCRVMGLPHLHAEFHLEYPKVPRHAVDAMLTISRQAHDDRGRPIETLFHLAWNGHNWRLTVPEQEGSASSVRPVNAGTDSSYASALIEVHSHHEMHAFWSGTDNRDEQGFRLYGVLGDIFGKPRLLLRVGLYGYFWELPADRVFNLPEGINETVREELSESGGQDGGA